MFSALLIAIGLGGAAYLGWHGAEASVVFMLALPIYVSMLITDKNRIVTAFTAVQTSWSPMAILKAVLYAIVIPYISGLVAVAIFFFVTKGVVG